MDESFLDIGQIRDQLNTLTFKDGKRSVCIGSISEMFEGQAESFISGRLQRIEEQLRDHDLFLSRGATDPDELYVTQELRDRAVSLAWMADALQWISKITTVALEMVVPAVVGMWLDQRLETSFLGLSGVVLGVALGLWHLVKMTRKGSGQPGRSVNPNT